MKIFLINLDKRADRLAFVQSQLDAIQLPFERIAAVYGADLTVEQQALFDQKRFVLEQKKAAVPGEIGCAMSHRGIWQQMVQQQLPYALILEDDIHINSKLAAFLADKTHYQDFDFLNLSANEPYAVAATAQQALIAAGSLVRPRIWQSRALWKQLEWRRRWRIFRLHVLNDGLIACECDPAPALGSGYILSLKGAEALLKTSETMFYPVDLTWRYSGGMLRQAFLAEPLITQSLGDTNIEGRYQGYKLNLWQRIQRFFVKSRRWRRRIDVIKMYGISRL
jgi:glycosyl transferase family 25